MAIENMSNNRENVNKNPSKQDYSMLEDAQESFIDRELKNDINTFKLWDAWFDNNVFNRFQNYVNSESRFNELIKIGLSKPDIKTSLIIQLRNKLVKSLLPREDMIKSLLHIFEKEYVLDGWNITDIKKVLNTMNHGEMKDYLKSERDRYDFLGKKNILKKDKIVKKDEKDIVIESLWINEKKYNSLTDNQKNSLINFTKTNSNISENEFKSLLSIFSDDEKVNIIKYFSTSISLKKLVEYWLFTKKEAKDYIVSRNSDILDKIVNPDEKNEIINWLNLDNFYILTSEIDNSKVKSIIWNDSVLRQIVNDINEMKEEIVTKKYSWLMSKLTPIWPNDDINSSFIEYIKNHPDNKKTISDDIKKTIDNLADWNYISIWTWESKLYYKIDKVDSWNTLDTKAIKLINISLSDWVVKKEQYWKQEIKDYSDIYDLLTFISSSKDKSINFMTKSEFDNLGLAEVVDDSSIKTKEQLKAKLDLVDKDWKDIPFDANKMVLRDDKQNNFIYHVDKIDDSKWTITVSWASKPETFTFSDFYTVFNAIGIKRVQKIDSTEGALSKISSILTWSDYGNIVLHNWKLIPKWKEKEKDVDINYLFWDKKYIEIKSIDSNKIDYVLWEYEEVNGKKEFKKGAVRKHNLNQFVEDVSINKMVPKNDKEVDETWVKEVQKTSSLLKSWFSLWSYAELMLALKQLPESVKSFLKEWNDLKAAKLALAMWRFLPKWVEEHLKDKQNSTYKDTVDKVIARLKKKNSWDLYKWIRDIVINTNSEQYEIEAALFTVIWKTWTLYPKDLQDLKWSFIWYEALWWKKWDKLYKKIEDRSKHQESKASWRPEPIPFTEETLVEELLKEQSKDWLRRPRIDKEFWWEKNKWIKEQMDDWKDKTAAQNAATWKINYWVTTLAWGEVPNWLWALAEIFKKNWSLVDMTAFPFIISVTWIAKTFDQPVLKYIIDQTWDTPYSAWLAFNTDDNQIDFYNKFIWKIAALKWPEVKASFDSINKEKWDEWKINAARDFWDKHWRVMADTLALNDGYIYAKKDSDPDFLKYVETIKWVQADDEYSWFKPDYISQWWVAKNTPVFTSKIVKRIDTSNHWALSSEAEKVANMHFDQLDRIKDNSELSDTEKRSLFREVFWTVEGRMRYKWETSMTSNKSNLWGIEFVKYLRKKNVDVYTPGWYPLWEESFYNEMYRRYMLWDMSWVVNIDNTKKETIEDIDDLLKMRSSNDSTFEKVKKKA